jgi:hypothetical protein
MQDNIDRCLLVDAAIQNKAEHGELAVFSSLPPWITVSSKKALRQMLHPDPGQRISSIADAAAALHQLRGNTQNWSFDGGIARLSTQGKVIELRATGSGLYEAFQQNKGAFRRVPGSKPGTLAELVKSCCS